MVTQLEYAAFTEGAYKPSGENTIVVSGWTRDSSLNGADRGNGFDASVFAKNDGSEVVVSFRGTDFEATLSGLADWTATYRRLVGTARRRSVERLKWWRT
jgi:hypothetical protein